VKPRAECPKGAGTYSERVPASIPALKNPPPLYKPGIARETGAMAQGGPIGLEAARILEAVTDAFVFLDLGWRFVYVNENAAQLLGRTAQDLAGKHIWTEFAESDKFRLVFEQSMREKRPLQLEDYYPPLDRWFEARAFPGPDGLAIFFQDTTDRRRI
jgi:PAS domain S-box-containing protein